MKLFFSCVVGSLLLFSSCKKCYECSKQNTITANGVDSIQSIQFDACNKGKESNGLNNGNSIKDYEANGYTCKAK